MPTLSVAAPGATLQTVDEGSGPPIVLLHAGIADLGAWDAMVPYLVDAGYRVIRYDRRGFGRTVSEDVAFSNRADVIAVLDACGVGRAAIVGNSAGGQITFDTAIEFPDRVVAAIGVGAGLGGFDGGATPEEEELFEEGDALESAEPPDPEAIADFDVRFWVDGPGQPADRVPAAIREAVREMDLGHYAPGTVDGQPIPLEPRAAERLAELTCPVLAVAGTLDASECVVTARHLEANAPNARAIVWDDVAHMIGMEQPERLATAIVEFLAPLPRWS
jgi:pimeloyl-ACP methyl ester carboxylesterase